LRLECGLDGRHVQLGLGPADDDLWGERSVRDHVTFRLLQADGSVGGTNVGAIVGSNGPVDGVDDRISRVALKVGDGPGVGGHGGVVVGRGVDYAASRADSRVSKASILAIDSWSALVNTETTASILSD